MKHRFLPYLSRSLLILMIVSTGCKSGDKRAPVSIDSQETGEIIERIEAMKQVYHLTPSPAEMLSVIDVAGLTYNGEIMNPVRNADRYLDTKDRTMALGIYITDLAYSALFGRHEETLDYLEVVQLIAEEIRLTGAIDDALIAQARDNVEYLDSLFNISNQAFINMLLYCERNEMPETIIMLSAGAFVESLYLAVNMVDDHEDSGFLLTHIADQKFAIDNLVLFAESMAAEDENIALVLDELQPLKEIYDGISAGPGELTVETVQDEEQPGKLVFGAETVAPPMHAEVFEQLKEETLKLRSKLAEG